MNFSVNIDKLIEGIYLQRDWTSSFLNAEDGSMVTLSNEELDLARKHTPVSQVPEWQHEHFLLAEKVIASESWLNLPRVWQADLTALKIRFLESKNSSEIPDDADIQTLNTLLEKSSLKPAWLDHYYHFVRKLAIEWCSKHEISYQ